ncbi:MAG: CocE/NonD family hydrolase, partial [Alphaproteobacteria bacterium]|nr:CocE/NonD family hydrolase [Alphaproteobacteria bacterium]
MLDQTGDDERLEQGDGAWLVPPDRYLDQNPPRFDGWQRSSCYVTVRDGTRVAVDVHLPAAREEGLRFPAIVLFTPYYRRFALKEGYNLEVEPSPNAAQFREAFVPYGYAVVVVDVRGTGASFGWRDGFRSPKERGDYYDVVDWIVAQPWSDGAVGATGISYVGAAADFLASTGHKAVKAIVPTFSVWDTWSNHLWPGGVLLTVVPTLYGKLCRAMDLDDREHVLKYAYFADPDFAGPAPVDDDEDGSLLAAAIAEHGHNVDMVGFADALEYRDSALAYDPDYTSASISPYHYAERANDMGTACLGVTGWMDGGGYSTGAIQRYTWQRNPARRLLIGPWDHGARAHVSPWRRAEALRFALLGEYLRFFDTHLKGLDSGLPEEKPIHYYTMGAEAWQAAATWPPGATSTMELFFDEAAKLNSERPRHGDGVDHYLADFASGSGRQTR